MCGCYELKAKTRALNRRFPQLKLAQSSLPRNGEFHPTDQVLMITRSQSGFIGHSVRWGLVGNFLNRPPLNPLLTLPSEGLVSTPFYSKILKRNRCLIPATAFHECLLPNRKKQRVRMSAANGELLVFAGIFDHHSQAGTTCAILTAATAASVGPIKHALPVMLNHEQSSFWLGEHADFPEADFVALLQAPSAYALTMETIVEAEPSPQLSLAFA